MVWVSASGTSSGKLAEAIRCRARIQAKPLAGMKAAKAARLTAVSRTMVPLPQPARSERCARPGLATSLTQEPSAHSRQIHAAVQTQPPGPPRPHQQAAEQGTGG